MFAALKGTPIINVGLRWSVLQSNAATSYTNLLRTGRVASDISALNGDGEAALRIFSDKADKALFTKAHFTMDEIYNGSIAYHSDATNKDIGEFVLWDAANNVPAGLRVGDLSVGKSIRIKGDIYIEGNVTSVGQLESKTTTQLDGLTVGTMGTADSVILEQPDKKRLDVKVGGLTRIKVMPTGSVGIGDFKKDESPTGVLHLRTIAGDATYAMHAERGNWRIRNDVELYVDAKADTLGDRLVIKKNGFIGIGTAAPEAVVHAAGAVIIDSGGTVSAKGGASLYITNALKEGYSLNVKDALVVTAAGNTCMGCTAPTQRLDVVGGIRTDTFKSEGNIFVKGLSTLSSVDVPTTLTATNVIVNSNFSIPGKIETSDDNGKAGGPNLHVFGHLLVDRSVIMTGGEGTPPWKLSERLEMLEEQNRSLQERLEGMERMFANMQRQMEL